MSYTTKYGQPIEWAETDEGHQTIYVQAPDLIPFGQVARVIYELRLDIERLNNEAIEARRESVVIHVTGNVVIITGDPVDGFTHYGPFADTNEAGDWAEVELRHDNWWVTTLKGVTS